MAEAHRTRMEQVAAGLSEGVLLIEPDRRIVYANAAALVMHGVATLHDLGTTVAEYRANFVLHYRNHREIGPLQHPLDRVLAGEVFRDAVVELRPARSPDRAWMHRIRSLVTTDADGAPDGLALIMQDVSDRYEAEARFEAMFRANPAPALILRLSDLRYVKVNQGFVDLTGYERDRVLGRTFTEIDVLTGAEHRTLALGHLHAGRTIPQMEACLRVPSDSERYVIVAGHPIAMPGGERCMLFTFADLEDRRKAEMALRASEERFAKAFALSPIPTVLFSLEAGVPSSVNEAFGAVYGDGEGPSPLPWIDEAERARFEGELRRGGRVRGFEGRLRTRQGDDLDGLVSAEPVTVNGADGLLCAVQDITNRKRSEAELVTAIEAVMADASWFSRGVIEKLALLRNPPRSDMPPALVATLTARETDMLDGICRGATDEEMSLALGLSRSTVRNHVASLYRKLGVNRRSAVVVWARERGLGAVSGGAKRPGRRAKNTSSAD